HADHAAQQIGPPQERAVQRRGAAEGDVCAATGAHGPAVQHVFLGAETDTRGVCVETAGDRLQVAPGVHRVHVYLDHAGVRGEAQGLHAVVMRWRVAFYDHGDAELGGGVLQGGDQIQVVLAVARRRHEDVEATLAGLHAQGRPHVVGGGRFVDT